MTKPSRFLSLAVSFLGLGFASACTYSKSLPTTAYDDSSTPEITEPEATPELPSEISKDLETEDTNEVIAPVEAAYAPDETDTDLGANDETDVEAPTDATQESPETPKDPGSGEIGTKGKRPTLENPGFDFGMRSKGSKESGMDTTAPEFQSITSSGDGKTFIIDFTEPVDVASLKAAFLFERYHYEWSDYGYVRVEGALTSTDGGKSGKSFRFVAYEPLIDLTPGHVSGVTFYRISIAGADSVSHSQAVHDTAGNLMAHEIVVDGSCSKALADASYEVECK